MITSTLAVLKDYIRELHAHAHTHNHVHGPECEHDHVHGPDCGHDLPADTEIMEIGESLVASETEFDTLIGGEEE